MTTFINEKQHLRFFLGKHYDLNFIGDYAVCVNAATLALIDAGIPIRDVCCAVSCGLVTKNGEAQTLVDLGNLKFYR